MNKDINEYTLKELQELEEYKPTKTFRWVVIIPMDEIHESGFRCMKFAVGNAEEICGVIYAGSDVVNPNGVSGMGKNPDYFNFERGFVPYIGLSADCLAGSGCVRLMMQCNCELDSFIGSSFAFYKTEEEQ